MPRNPVSSFAAAFDAPADPALREEWITQWRNARLLAIAFAMALAAWVILLYGWLLPERPAWFPAWLFSDSATPAAVMLAEGTYWICVTAVLTLALKSRYHPGLRPVLRKGRSRIQRALLRTDDQPEPFMEHEKWNAYSVYAIPFLALFALCHLILRFVIH